MDNSLVFYKIKKIIEDVYREKNVNPNTTINSFNSVSEDNDEFFRRFQKEFNVDMTFFNYYDYFYEDQFILFGLIKKMLIKLNLIRITKKSITISHLIKVAEEGKWVEFQS